MSLARFSRYVLRTTDVTAATAFYDSVLERHIEGIVQLHEAAVARGARPHWLGQIGVKGLGGSEAVLARFVERGAVRLGPAPGVADFVILRDPGGAIVAVSDGAPESSAGVVWHQLNTNDPTSAAEHYSSLFGWAFGAKLDLGQLGQHQRFAFAAGESSVGLFSDVASRPQVHTHWLFYFAVRSLDVALERVRTQGGVVVGPIELPNGVRVAVCDDAQGAAFGVIDPHGAAKLASE
jgi:predicted enzyme related to lactoylglutathione lyase